MRIAIIAPPWVPVPPPAYGGIEVVLDDLARGLQGAGHDVLLYATGDSSCPVPIAWALSEAVGVGGATPATELHHVVNAYEAVLDWGAEVIHDHTLCGPVYAERFDVAVVTTNHGPFESELGDYYRAIAPSIPIIAISAHQAASAGETPIAAVLHHGVDTDRFTFGPGDAGYAVFLGRMNADKGVHTAVAAARAAGVPLRLAAKLSEPHEQDYFDEQIGPILGDGIDYVGEVGGDDKTELLGGASCLLNPIDWSEPFGMVMIEALACGTPVVATHNGSAPEIVDHGRTGFLCDGEAELAEALSRCGTLDRAACRSDAVERFSVERMVAGHVALYEAVAKGERPSWSAPIPGATTAASTSR